MWTGQHSQTFGGAAYRAIHQTREGAAIFSDPWLFIVARSCIGPNAGSAAIVSSEARVSSSLPSGAPSIVQSCT
jgi:hypothetical protein